MLAVKLVAHVDHGSAIVDAAFWKAFCSLEGAEHFPMLFAMVVAQGFAKLLMRCLIIRIAAKGLSSSKSFAKALMQIFPLHCSS